MMLLLRDSKICGMVIFDAFNLKFLDNHSDDTNQVCVEFRGKRRYERLVVAKSAAAVVVIDAVR